MKSGYRIIFALIPLFAVSASTAQPAPSVVHVDTGSLAGVTAAGVTAYKGIPFAAPPVDELRWRAPKPAAAWSGVRDASSYGHDCMQLPFPSDAAPLGTQPAEDCLVINVWRPAQPSAHKLPVMVWIYGGGFVNGGSSPAVYDGSQFAKQGIVFVSFNYRLGRFGFFAHPALSAEHPDEPTGNFGLMDQIAALQWVQRNIGAFGGDNRRVTLFGESAGGGSVLSMLTSPLTNGLFQQAMIESGGGRDGFGGMALLKRPGSDGRPSAEAVGVAFAHTRGIDDAGAAGLKALRALPADKIVDGLNMASMMAASATYTGVMIDGKIVTESPQSAFLAGRQKRVPLLIGTNSADLGFSFAKSLDEVFAPFGANADKARKAYGATDATDPQAVGVLVAADKLMIEPARFVAREVTRWGQPAYEYRFSYVATSRRAEWTAGAPHATEIPYVFDTVSTKYGTDLSQTDAAVARGVHAYWVAFVKTGRPEAAGLPPWPAYVSAQDKLLDFTSQGKPIVTADPWRARLDIVAEQNNESAPPGKTPTP